MGGEPSWKLLSGPDPFIPEVWVLGWKAEDSEQGRRQAVGTVQSPTLSPCGTERRRLMHFTAWGQPGPTREDRAGKNPSLRIGESPLVTLHFGRF